MSLLVTFPVVWLLKLFRAGQPARAEAPAAHQAKAGTPTMGGIGFILTILVLALILIDFDLHPDYLALILLTLAFALIGLADDLLKLLRRQNLGLSFWQKILLQIMAAGAFAIFLVARGQNFAVYGLLGRLTLNDPYLYQLLVVFWVVGFANATNLTDGLNGLLGGTAALAFIFLAIFTNNIHVAEPTTFALVCSGAAFAFLYFNFPKAKVFMGRCRLAGAGRGAGRLGDHHPPGAETDRDRRDICRGSAVRYCSSHFI